LAWQENVCTRSQEALMHAPSLSTYIVSAVVGAAVLTVAYDSSLAQFVATQFQTTKAEAALATTVVNRERKGDRLDAKRADLKKNTTVVMKNTVPDHAVRDANDTPVRGLRRQIDDGKPAPAPLQHCEALASPVSDPILGKIMGRCFV
jgi:hypothetical protein